MLASGTTQLRCNPADFWFHLGTSLLSSQMELLDNVHFGALCPKPPYFLLIMHVALLALTLGVETMGSSIEGTPSCMEHNNNQLVWAFMHTI